MKKLIYLIVLVLILGLFLTGCSVLSNMGQVPVTEQTKVKPTDNLAGAEEVAWNLSGAVMPVQPWGLSDITGSDIASKLIINQPNGNVEVAVTGVMKGLDPNTTYTVFPANAWTQSTVWDVTGIYTIDLTVGLTPYVEFLDLQQSGNIITGTSLALAGNMSPWTIDSGTVNGTTVAFLAHFNANSSLQAQFDATIDESDGSMNGTWHDVLPITSTRNGVWNTTSGNATSQIIGNGWPGLFPGQETFTFMTDEYGAGSWHFNLKNDDFPAGSDIYNLSVWINGAGGTILISNNFSVVVE